MASKSTIVPLRTLETIEQEAATWMAKLDRGNLSDAERHALRQWLSEDPRHCNSLKELASIWGDMDELLNPSYANEKDELENPFWFSGVRWAQALTLVCVLSFAYMGWNTFYQAKLEEVAIYSTDVGSQQVQSLSDGSKAYLNTDSIIETEFSDKSRVVRLLHGEAMFDVAHDPERPFVVYVGDREVKAIGTKFIVRLTSENMIVTVTEGQVQLSRRNEVRSPINVETNFRLEQEVILLSKGQEVEVKGDNTQSVPKAIDDDEMDQRVAWLDGQFLFKDKPLEQVIKEVSRYVPTRIIIDDPELRNVRISGRFEIGDTDALFEAIEVSFDVQVSYIDEKIIRLSH